MPSMQVNKSQTLYRTIENSKPVQFAKENRAVAGATATGVAILGKQLVDNSQMAANILKKGVVPALGAGVAVYGGAMIHDAVVNDQESMTDRLKLGAEGAAGIVLGTEIAGQGLNIKALQPITQTTNFLVKHKHAVGNMAITGLAAAGTGYAIKNMTEEGVNLGNAMGATAGATGVAMFGKASATTIFGPASKVTALVDKGGSGLVGAGLGVSAYALGKETYGAIQEGSTSKALLFGLGTAATGLGSVHFLGNMTGVPALSNIAGKVFGKNPVVAGAVALTALGVGSYMVYQQSEKAAQEAK